MGRRLCRRHVRLGEKRGDLVGPTKRGKGTKLMLLVDGAGLPLAVDIDCASLAEVNLIEPLLDQGVTPCVPPRLIYDRAAIEFIWATSLGEWNTIVIECVNDEVKEWVNGDLLNHGFKSTADKGQIAVLRTRGGVSQAGADATRPA